MMVRCTVAMCLHSICRRATAQFVRMAQRCYTQHKYYTLRILYIIIYQLFLFPILCVRAVVRMCTARARYNK